MHVMVDAPRTLSAISVSAEHSVGSLTGAPFTCTAARGGGGLASCPEKGEGPRPPGIAACANNGQPLDLLSRRIGVHCLVEG